MGSSIQVLEKNYHAKNTGFQWVQPPLSPEQKACSTLFLYSYPLGDDSVTDEERVQALRGFVNSFYETFPVEGKFVSDEGQFNAPQKFAKFCENMSKQALVCSARIYQGEVPEETVSKYNDHKDIILEKVRKMMVEKDGKLQQEDFDKLKGAVSAIEIEVIDSESQRKELVKPFKDEDIKGVLRLAFTEVGREFKETQEAVQGMVQGLDEMARDPSKFYGKENCDDEKVKAGQERLREYYTSQDRENARKEVKDVVAEAHTAVDEAKAVVAGSSTLGERIAALKNSGMNVGDTGR